SHSVQIASSYYFRVDDCKRSNHIMQSKRILSSGVILFSLIFCFSSTWLLCQTKPVDRLVGVGQADDRGTKADTAPSSRPEPGKPSVVKGDAAAAAESVDSCDAGMKRALVLSGGGLKGAFQAGAVYHLIVDRHCDFREFAGVSVGSLNVVILAQAARDENPDVSLKNLTERAEKLVKIWQD